MGAIPIGCGRRQIKTVLVFALIVDVCVRDLEPIMDPVLYVGVRASLYFRVWPEFSTGFNQGEQTHTE